MRFLIIDSLYPAFISDYARRHPAVHGLPYDEQLNQWIAARFGHSDYYSRNLRALGHDAADILFNVDALQGGWAARNAPHLSRWRRFADSRWRLAVLEEQIRATGPDVVYIHDMDALPAEFVHHVRSMVGRVVGQVASPLDFGRDWSGYDDVFTSLPHFVDLFRARGVRAHYLPLAFEPSLLDELPPSPRDLPAVFIGSFSSVHIGGGQVLETVAASGLVRFWGAGVEHLPPTSAVPAHHHGPAWGIEMLATLRRARISLNRHIDVAAGYANNMRMFESTGVGTCLLTEYAPNLSALFTPDVEVVTYRDADDCVDKLRCLLDDDAARERIAVAGQERTLRDHTYRHRAEQILEVLESSRPRRTVGTPLTTRFARRPDLLAQARSRVAASPGGPLAKRIRARLRPSPSAGVSRGHRVIDGTDAGPDLRDGWRDSAIPARQRQIVDAELAAMRQGRPGPPFRVAAEAVETTGLNNATLLEIGCASAYYSDVFREMTSSNVSYIGLDYSEALVHEGRRHYPRLPLAAADATRLPFRSSSVDIAFSSCAILHIPDWATAVDEMVRVARRYWILHRTPVVRQSATTWFEKVAYDVPVVELVFRESDLLDQLRQSGVTPTREWIIDEYVLPGLDERVQMKTYLGDAAR